ncbi:MULTISPECIES: hypothetical protein [Pseudomonas]|uniref:Uncharacterized protein n=1 Tax=Pseudomonas tritici TaxID=2745518 RepID=A0A8I0CYL9_9PSED|nr:MULTISPECIES: hypothetical protein [Pseudomonas]MBP2872653.1 hypothetical protein [Pseudomonas sp. SWRI144]MBY8928871.1 hypothetical protein [Pseudomonas sp. Wu6]QXH84065.1 hypothetical protein HU722_0000845 [Pseudomonas tritici]
MNASEDGLLEPQTEIPSQFGHVQELPDSKSKPLDDRFSEWNLRLLHSFFSEASKGEEVFLRVDKEFLDQIGQDIGGDAGFLDAVRIGHIWANPDGSLAQRIRDLVEQRKGDANNRNYMDPGALDPTYLGLHAPAYLPYLAALIRNDAENPNSYYGGLQADLKLHHTFGPNEMDRVESAWADLQKWTERNAGRFGSFKLRRLGGYHRIGVPRSQSILKPQDIESLAQAFVQAQIRPGQELSKASLSRILDEARATKRIFTAGFQKALDIPDFEQPILAAISTAYSDWDGTLTDKNSSSHYSSTDLKDLKGVGISLVVVQDAPLEISPRWRLPALQDTGKFVLSHNELKWKGCFSGTEGTNCTSSAKQDAEFWRIAEQASENTLQFNVQYLGIEESEPTTLQLLLRRHLLWVLVPAFDSVTGNLELREGDLPGSGQAFLLAPPHSFASLKSYLERVKPDHKLISAAGIPDNWLFVNLVACDSLTLEQRLLPDGEECAHPKPRSIRFVGGRSIRRGYSRMYLPYDLPMIELDAPEDTRITCSQDIIIHETFLPTYANTGEQAQLIPLRRFEIRLPSARSASYVLHATTKNGTQLGQAKLRVAGLGGDFVDIGRPFSLDNLGIPMTSDEGLSGVFLPVIEQSAFKVVGFDLKPVELGAIVKHDAVIIDVRKKFLDSLAQSGSFDYGVARNQLQRLIRTSDAFGDPALILLDLCRRGHLEISRTHKGHIARIHSVKPTFYSLPSTSHGPQIWGVAGTLRISHWENIARAEKAWTTHSLITNAVEFESWRLLIINEFEAKKTLDQIGFQLTQTPCISIANWAGSLKEFTNVTLHNTMESIGSARGSAMRFHAGQGRFTANPCGNTSELWKVQDLDTGMDNLYVLADQGRYAFVRDSRWGVWLALDAFAKWVSIRTGLEDLHPIPITYERNNGTVWLPARIGLPSVLERALVLCAGYAPEVLTLQKQETNGSGNRISLSYTVDGPTVFFANRFYNDMAEGKWLAYRHVPEVVANLIATKLGAVLDIF